MNKRLLNQIIMVSASIICLFANVVHGAAKKQECHLKKGMESLFEYIGAWGDDGKPFGWLLVRENKHTQGKVLAKLDGKSYVDSKVPNAYSVSYIAYDSNGARRVLPRGLYAWQKPGDSKEFKLIDIRPAYRNRYAANKFHYDIHWYSTDNKGREIKWNPAKEKYAHPSKEISDIIER